MTSDQAAVTLLKRGKHVEEFPAKQAARMLQLQKEMGTQDYQEVDPNETAEPPATEPETQSSNAVNGPTGDQVNPDTDKRGSAKAGS